MITFNQNTHQSIISIFGIIQIILFSLKVFDYAFRSYRYARYSLEPTYTYMFIVTNFQLGKTLYKFLLLTNKSDLLNDIFTFLSITLSLALSVQSYIPYKYLGHKDHQYFCKKLKLMLYNILMLLCIGLPYAAALAFFYTTGEYYIGDTLLWVYYGVQIALGLVFIATCYMLRKRQLNLSYYHKRTQIAIILIFALASLILCSISLYTSFKTVNDTGCYNDPNPATNFCQNVGPDSKSYKDLCQCKITGGQIENCELTVSEQDHVYLEKMYTTGMVSLLLQMIPFSTLILTYLINFTINKVRQSDIED